MSLNCNIHNLIFFVYPDPKGSEENQFTPLGAGVNKLIFKLPVTIYLPIQIVVDDIVYELMSLIH
jgi:hypothetical protein